MEAIRKFGSLADEMELDLSEAYKKALPMYASRLRRTFILLGDRDDSNPSFKGTGANKEPIGEKRSMKEDPTTSLPKKGKN